MTQSGLRHATPRGGRRVLITNCPSTPAEKKLERYAEVQFVLSPAAGVNLSGPLASLIADAQFSLPFTQNYGGPDVSS